jgi:hypothetical protein
MAKTPSRAPSGGGKHRPPSSGGSGYEVGYGKPPKKNQFKAGVSGNPRGRKRRGLYPYDPVAGFTKVLTEGIRIRLGDKTAKIPLVEALARTLLKKALEGDARAALTLIKVAKELNLLRPRQPIPLNYSILTDEELETLQKLFGKLAGDKDSDSDDAGAIDSLDLE